MQVKRARQILARYQGLSGYDRPGPYRRPSCLARARQYMLDVVSGKRAANLYERAAVIRQLKDLDRRRWKYRFNVELAEWYCSRLELFKHYEGKQFAGKPFILEGWQCFIQSTVFGWVDSNGLRRFHYAYIEVPRKNGKTPFAAGNALLALGPDEEPGAQVYAAASKETQAGIMLKHARMMAERCPDYLDAYGVNVNASTLSIDDPDAVGYGSLLKALTSAGDDGLNVHFAVIDEVHQHRNRILFDSLDTATAARSQPLLFMITTAGVDITGICYEQREYVVRLLTAVMMRKTKPFNDDNYFGIIYTVDQELQEDRERLMTDERLWKMANPNYGVSVSPLDFKKQARKARQSPGAQNTFLTKKLDIWCRAGAPWMDLLAFDKCTDLDLSLEQFRGREAVLALDLASKTDIASLAITFLDGEDLRHGTLSALCKHYLPRAAVEKSKIAAYQGWADEGHLTVTDGNITDYDRIEADIEALASVVQIVDIAYDPAQATMLATHLQDKGFALTEIVQTYNNLSEPMQETEAAVIDGRFRHNGEPVLTWSMGNVITKMRVDTEQIRPGKEREENKIDPAVAIIMAVNRWLHEGSRTSVYDTRGVVSA